MSYFRMFPLKEPQRANPMIATGTTMSGVQSSGNAHIPQNAATTRMNTGATTHQGHGFSFITGTVGDPRCQ